MKDTALGWLWHIYHTRQTPEDIFVNACGVSAVHSSFLNAAAEAGKTVLSVVSVFYAENIV
jgi:hypothetical protein